MFLNIYQRGAKYNVYLASNTWKKALHESRGNYYQKRRHFQTQTETNEQVKVACKPNPVTASLCLKFRTKYGNLVIYNSIIWLQDSLRQHIIRRSR